MTDDRRLDDLSDEELGKIVRSLSKEFARVDDEKERVIMTTAILFIIRYVIESGSDKVTSIVEDVTIPEPVGNWKLVLEKVE